MQLDKISQNSYDALAENVKVIINDREKALEQMLFEQTFWRHSKVSS